MDRDRVSRRQFVALTSISLATIPLAGCAENGGDDGTPTPADGMDETPTPEGGEETPTPTPEDGEGTPTPEDGDGTPTPENGDGDGADPSAWEDVEEVFLDGYTEAWEGVAPEPINGEENPTLVLFEGNEYTVTWENRDGAPHDFALWDENEEVIDSTEQTDEEGETLSLTFEATTDIAQYVCTVHPTTMIGDVQIESG